MAQTAAGARKIAAAKAGCSVAEYGERLGCGQKFCYGCRDWKWSDDDFTSDASRFDGKSPLCRTCRRELQQRAYVPRVRENGKSFVPARDGDKKQARRRINYFVEAGIIPAPNSLPCRDCGHQVLPGSKRRHEYDHHLGYAAEHHEHVEAVCSKCHHQRHANDKQD